MSQLKLSYFRNEAKSIFNYILKYEIEDTAEERKNIILYDLFLSIFKEMIRNLKKDSEIDAFITKLNSVFTDYVKEMRRAQSE